MSAENLPEQEQHIDEISPAKGELPQIEEISAELLNEGYCQVINLISSIPSSQARTFLTASLIAISLNFLPGDISSNSGENDISAANPLIGVKSPPLPSANQKLNPDLAYSPSNIDDTFISNEVDAVEYLDTVPQETYFVVPNENNSRGYDLIESLEMAELSEADKIIVESSRNVLPITVALPFGANNDERMGDRLSSMNLVGESIQLGPSVYLNEALLTAHSFKAAYNVYGEDVRTPEDVVLALRGGENSKMFPYSAEFAPNYIEEGLDNNETDSARVKFLTHKPLNYVEGKREILTREQISQKTSLLDGKDVWVTGYPVAVNGGELTRVIMKGKVSDFDFRDDGTVGAINIIFPEILDDLILNSFGISGGKVSFIAEVDGELVEFVIGTYKGHLAATVDGVLTNDLICSKVIPFESMYVESSLRNAGMSGFKISSELSEGSATLDDVRSLLFSQADDGYSFDRALQIVNSLSHLDILEIQVQGNIIGFRYREYGEIKFREYDVKLLLEMPSAG